MKRINTHHYNISSSSSSPFYHVHFVSAGTNNCFTSGRPANNQYQQHQHKIIHHMNMNIINIRRRSHQLSSNMILLFLRFSVITMMMCIRLVSTHINYGSDVKRDCASSYAGSLCIIPWLTFYIYTLYIYAYSCSQIYISLKYSCLFVLVISHHPDLITRICRWSEVCRHRAAFRWCKYPSNENHKQSWSWSLLLPWIIGGHHS